jgi:hypothetical protein
MIAFAPGRFSTTPGWPHSSLIFCAKMRAWMSMPEPAACGTMILIGRLGKSPASCAAAPMLNAIAAMPANTARSACRFMGASLRPVLTGSLRHDCL